ncbi:hypothetical protein NUW54_g7458 [Trametes sanguinea]|uniref:Uncharacterized protein n=1 Tax=Trametes sanguinea TaxID=158606 RepID=A0ACC1PKZ7_9APHY|nr:hypothetical protein NUW54_g7458 [Trametes sanguinea]
MARRKISRDLKERSVALAVAGWTVKEIANALGVSRQSVARWALRAHSHHDFTATSSPLQGRPRILSSAILEDLRDLLRSSPSLYLDEIVTWLAVTHDQPVSISTVHKALAGLGYTYKKLRKTAAQRDELTRTQCMDTRTTHRTYGRAPAGQRATEKLSFKRGVRYSILPALSLNGFLTVRVLPKMNPYPGPNSVLIVDNCSTHKSEAVREAVEAAGCLYLFLPPYSPDYNPIEEAFSCVKYHFRRKPIRSDDEDNRPEIVIMEGCMGAVTAEKARGWYADCGYL